jgi:protein-L-isoaspartate O-methyltransferase
MVLPLGDDNNQLLKVLIKNKDGYDIESLEEVRFVPLQGGVLV